ncbi:hypothetical protein NDU88_008593 [Pleurodeles waltl]|uniref:Uncharacterized protein n=1 Tax=Pleurodeles waltl TaxID=8319 RepID=A0AAV7PSH7_PLEWA|nr:hypothetical protein NDU88_008593 [Pleurodeles waltl]
MPVCSGRKKLDIIVPTCTGAQPQSYQTWNLEHGVCHFSLVQSLSITNDKALVEAVDLNTFDLSNIKEQYLSPSQLSEKANQSLAVLQQEKVSNLIIEVSSDMSELQQNIGARELSNINTPVTNNSPPDGSNRNSKTPPRSHLPAEFSSCKLGDLAWLHASHLSALHTSTSVLNMQLDKLDLQIDLMNVMATHIADINRKVDMLAIWPPVPKANVDQEQDP